MSKLRPHIRLIPVVLFLALPVLAEAHTAATEEDILPAEYAVYQSIPLNPIENGIEGSLQILQDKRLFTIICPTRFDGLVGHDKSVLLAAIQSLRR
jgi:hypothetical protein